MITRAFRLGKIERTETPREESIVSLGGASLNKVGQGENSKEKRLGRDKVRVLDEDPISRYASSRV